MKSKRQTIWLVSMLSLMVILSAYYLFTEDSATNKPKTADGKQVTTMEQAATQETIIEGGALSDDDIIVTEVTAEDDAVKDMLNSEEQPALDSESTDASKQQAEINEKTGQDGQKSEQPEAADQASESVKDEDVLKKLESEGTLSRDYLTAYQMDRAEQNTRKHEQLMQTMNDDKKSLDEAAMAQQQLSALEEKEAKITDIEERLQQQYANAVVTEDNDSYRVVVISEKLQVKEAVSIVDMVIKELGVSQDKVQVQYVSQ
ncbi:SpoIIIAH-like family protein [Paenibacillus bouchesdurhonensis]|uniref:SpoIIIAH-like family protein n=1 Tax=Paenibacillus bouchesdurhonensis TaxID=1870990 RepID=UPI000DA5FF21|nr:SpoIIIAH-like family protein [Paenibacillus bouchesdurhonensis]